MRLYIHTLASTAYFPRLLAACSGTGLTMPPEERPLTPLLLFTVTLIGAFAFLQVYSVQAILPLLLRDLQATVVQGGHIVGATVLAVAFMSPFMGMLSDAVGRKGIIVASVFFMGLATAAMCMAGSIRQMVLLRFLQGLAVPGISVVLIAYLGEEFRGHRMARVMSFYVAGTVLGGFSGRFLLGHLSVWTPWRQAFLLLALPNLLGAVLVWRVLPASRNFTPNPNAHASLQMLAQHLRNRSVLAACALGFFVLFSLVGCFTYVNLHLAAPPYQLNTAQLGNIFAVYLLGVVITPLAGRLLPRLGFRNTMLLALAMSMCGLLLSLQPGVPGIVVALAIMSSGVFITQSATISFIAYKVEKGRSLASGLYYMTYYSGGFIGAWLCGIAYTHGHWPATVIALVTAQAVGVMIAWVWMPRRGD
ncbi:MAG: MFS transporter [Brachymonas sp.]|nr:MFS transporter [Brachymonas sp.]